MNFTGGQKKIYTVTQLTHEIHETLDSNFSFFWVTGEISNFAAPSSGHYYFSLKDSKALISAVIFKNQQKNLKFRPENGLEVVGFGRISVYPPRGSYQVIFEYLEPKGLGSLQLLFEQTKEKLKSEGLFLDKHKKELPFLPDKISLVTSPTGAAIRDILKVFSLRFENIEIEILPVKVQGEDSAGEIIEALKILKDNNDTDLIIIARGGGSFEDLMAFNSEELARMVFDLDIPVISGVGHETDFTILDFVADLRAPTPTAAAEYAVPDKSELLNTIKMMEKRLSSSFKNFIRLKKEILNKQKNSLRDPKREIENLRIQLDEKSGTLERRIKRFINIKKEKLNIKKKSITEKKMDSLYLMKKNGYEDSVKKLIQSYLFLVESKKSEFEKSFSKLYELGPDTILNRGYSITRQKDTKKILRSVKSDVNKGDDLEIILSDGRIFCNVNEIKEDE